MEIGRDRHPADIIADLKKIRLSVRGLSIEFGLKPDTLREALRRPYIKGEAIIAHALDKSPAELWPSRYDEDPKRTEKAEAVFDWIADRIKEAS